jgi:DNA-binding transcriptional MerR regulator/methylmalonyl-CoA mutase cobalamin-binding subunit
MEELSEPRLIPIGAVSQRTGLSQHVLRIWERRYSAVEPTRRDDGTRGYTRDDVVKLRLLKTATESGYPISRVAGLSTERLIELLREASESGPTTDAAVEKDMTRILSAAASMNGALVHDLLMRALITRGADSFVIDLLPPLLNRTGDMWEDGTICPSHEHLLSTTLQRVGGWAISQLSPPDNAPVILAATLKGQRHEMGAMMCGILASAHGWRVEYLGADLPASDIARAAKETSADAIALSIVHRMPSESLMSEIDVLQSTLGPGVKILIGGREVVRHRSELTRAGVITIDSLEKFLERIENIADTKN